MAEPKKILIVSTNASLTDLAYLLKNEGNKVKMFIQTPSEKEILDGIIEKTDDWEKEVEWADIIVFDDVGYGKKQDELRKRGKLVVGGSEFGDKLELDRDFAVSVLQSVGAQIIPSKRLQDFDEAIKFIKENKRRYVIKPNGKMQNHKELSYVGQLDDGEDVIFVLNRFREAYPSQKPDFELQWFTGGIEIALSVYFNGKDWVKPFCVNFEHKKFFTGDIGPNTMEMGTAMYFADKNKLFDEILSKLTKQFADNNHVGCVDINCIVNENGTWPLEFTCRFGYPAICIESEAIRTAWTEFLFELAKGELKKFRAKGGFQVGVVLAVPPFPYASKQMFDKLSKDIPIVFDGKCEGFHLGDLKIKSNALVLAGSYGFAAVVVGTGDSMAEAKIKAYDTIKRVKIPNMYYRMDIGDRWEQEYPLLKRWGYVDI